MRSWSACRRATRVGAWWRWKLRLLGKAVLGTDIDGLRDAVRHDETGVLVPPDDVGALAAGMQALIAGRRDGGGPWGRRVEDVGRAV